MIEKKRMGEMRMVNSNSCGDEINFPCCGDGGSPFLYGFFLNILKFIITSTVSL